MEKVRFITRADDAGSSRAANAAMGAVIRAGVIKNVSVMAPGKFVEEAAELFARERRVNFGLHATLNAEWDRVKWGPLTALDQKSGLVDRDGAFLADPKEFEKTRPPVELVMKEYQAQLDKLCRAGFKISYVDTHMAPERFIPGLDEALRDWAAARGLLDHLYYYHLPPRLEAVKNRSEGPLKYFRSLPPGEYFWVAHPARYGPEMLLTGNREAGITGEQVARGRDKEARFFGNPLLKFALAALGISAIRYDQAAKGRRMDWSEISLQEEPS
jgi:hypothetical protein